MAEPISIQQLKDASLDANSLGEAVNGDENSVVTTRLGETYPTLSNALNQIGSKLDSANAQIKQGITNLFENGGLPATPFATKALMTASALVDGKYAMVTDDADNNGLYLKKEGAWVKSSYDPATINKEIAEKILNIKPELGHLIEINNYKDNYYNSFGVEVINSSWETSGAIPVKKGDCFIYEGVENNLLDVSIVSFCTSEGIYSDTLVNAKQQLSTLSKDELKLTGVGLYNFNDSFKNYSVVIPNDGFICVSRPKRISGKVAELYKTTFKNLLNNSQIQAPSKTLERFDGILHSVIFDNTRPTNGSLIFHPSQGLNQPIVYLTNQKDSSISKPISIKKGQYIHVHAHTQLDLLKVVFEDSMGRYLGAQDIVSSNSVSFVGTGHASFNIESKYNGFYRIGYKNDNLTPALTGITDYKVAYEVDYLKKGEPLEFYENITSTQPLSFNSELQNTTLSYYTESHNTSNAFFVVSKPYTLRKGDVLRYTLGAASLSTLAIVMENGASIDNIVMSKDASRILRLEDTRLYTREQYTQWDLNGKKASPAFYVNAEKASVDYCNDDSDTVIIFLRPTKNSDNFELYKQSIHNEVDVMSKEQYKKIRDKEIADNFTKINAVEPDWYTGKRTVIKDKFGTGSFPPVLLFKGEVLSYLTNHVGYGVAEQIGNKHVAWGEGVVLSPDNMYSRVRATGVDSIDYANLKITSENPLSYRYSQVYAKKTCVFYPYVKEMNDNLIDSLDVEGMIANKHYPARVMDINDIVLGSNMLPTTYAGTYFLMKNAVDKLEFLAGASTNMMLTTSFLPKNANVEASYWSNTTAASPVSGKIDTSNPIINGYEPVTWLDKDKGLEVLIGQEGQYKTGITMQYDGLLLVPTQTAIRKFFEPNTNNNEVNIENPYMVDAYERGIKSIPKATMLSQYGVTSSNRIRIPETGGITFNICTINSNSLAYSIWSKVQILQNDRVIAVLNAITTNQGQSTATLPRRNVELEFYNNKYEEVYIQFGDYIETKEVVLKSYLNSDKGHFKDITSSNLWHSLRTADPYPIGGVVPFNVMNDVSEPTNQKARGTPFGFPVELHRGSKFASLSTLRTKKKRENYAMQKSNKNHILMEADWLIANAVVNWKDVNLRNFEIRNPSIKGYVAGSLVLPTGYDTVQTAAARVLQWMQDCYNGVTDIASTYQDYIHLDSFLDYALAIAVSGNEDGVWNNFLLGTHDANIWRVYFYDADGGWGGTVADKYTAINWMDTSNIFRKIANTMPVEYKARYAHHRKLGTISAKTIQKAMMDLSLSQHSDSKKLDAIYWGSVSETSNLPYNMKWCKERIDYLDTLYGYTA